MTLIAKSLRYKITMSEQGYQLYKYNRKLFWAADRDTMIKYCIEKQILWELIGPNIMAYMSD